jgi:hypothetical protein
MKQPSVLIELEPVFEKNAPAALANTQLRRNMGKATQTIRAKRASVVDELPDWEALREAGRAIKERTLRHLHDELIQLETAIQQAGGQVHWARDAAEANRIVVRIVTTCSTPTASILAYCSTSWIGVRPGSAVICSSLANCTCMLGENE